MSDTTDKSSVALQKAWMDGRQAAESGLDRRSCDYDYSRVNLLKAWESGYKSFNDDS